MTRRFAFAAILLFSSTAHAALPNALLRIEKKYGKAGTLEGNFSQTANVALTGVKKESSGVLMIQLPGKFRWETLKPDKNLTLTDGKTYWHYTPPFAAGERGQVFEGKSAATQSELASALLSGEFSKLKNVTFEKKPGNVYRLVPKKGSSGTLVSADLEIDPKKDEIRRVSLNQEGGNQVEVRLQELKLGGKIDPAFFRFVTPPGTDVIKE